MKETEEERTAKELNISIVELREIRHKKLISIIGQEKFDKLSQPKTMTMTMTAKKDVTKKELPSLTPSEIGKVIATVLVNKGNKKTSFKTFCKAMKPDEFIKLTEEINKLMAETIEEEQKKLDKLKLLFPKFEK